MICLCDGLLFFWQNININEKKKKTKKQTILSPEVLAIVHQPIVNLLSINSVNFMKTITSFTSVTILQQWKRNTKQQLQKICECPRKIPLAEFNFAITGLHNRGWIGKISYV